MNLLKDDSSNICKKSILSAMCNFLPLIIKSNHVCVALDLILHLLDLKYSTYNLVKCELVQLLSSINFRALYFAENKVDKNISSLKFDNDLTFLSIIDLQNRLVNDIFLPLLGSEDTKLRLETARRFVCLVENLYYHEIFEYSVLLAEANYLKGSLNLLCNNNQDLSHMASQLSFSGFKTNSFALNFVQPFKNFLSYPEVVCNPTIKRNLNIILPLILNNFTITIEKYRLFGCLEALDCIFQVYEPTYYLNSSLLGDFLNVLVSYLQHPFITFDLYINELLLRIIGSFYCGCYWKFLKKLEPNSINTEYNLNTSHPWCLLFNNDHLISITDILFTHLLHVLCIIATVIDENAIQNSTFNFGNNASSGSTTLLAATLSGVTSKVSSAANTNNSSNNNVIRFKGVQDSSDIGSLSKSNDSVSNITSNIQTTNVNPSIGSKLNNLYIGSFQNNSIYMKLYDSIKLAYSSYRKSANINSNDKFCKFIRSILKLISQLMECSLSTYETSKFLDELLLYLKITFTVDSENSVKCITQILKSLFNMNFSSLHIGNIIESINTGVNFQQKMESLSLSSSKLNSSNRKLGLFTVFVKGIVDNFFAFIQNQSSIFKNDGRYSNSMYNSSTSDTLLFENEKPDLKQLENQNYNSQTNSSKGSFNLFNFMNNISRKKPSETTSQKPINAHKFDSKLVSQYIRSFEAIVIKSLRQYTVTSSVNLQFRILELLIQLIFLKVNYSLLDSDKVFIEYVLKQFEFLEQKHCCDLAILESMYSLDSNDILEYGFPESNVHNPLDIDTNMNLLLIHGVSQPGINSQHNLRSNIKHTQHKLFFIITPKLFEFLILLSYERVESKPLITIPNIMQLCDNLLASENSPHTHVIPALRALVYELFFNTKLKANFNKETELQRDVLVMALIRLINYPQIWQLLSIISCKYREEGNDDKWKKLSRQICDGIFQGFKLDQLKFNEYQANEIQASKQFSRFYNPYLQSLKHLLILFNSLTPVVYRPIDFIIKSFVESINFNVKSFDESGNNWLCYCISHINLFINYSNEEHILNRLHDLELTKIDNNINFAETLTIDYENTYASYHMAILLLKVIEKYSNFISECIEIYNIDPFKRFNNFSLQVMPLQVFNYRNLIKIVDYSNNLIYNYILYLIYFVRCGYWKKVSSALSHLITSTFNYDENNTESKEIKNPCLFLLKINKIMIEKVAYSYPLLAILWQYLLASCNYHESLYWSLSLNEYEKNYTNNKDYNSKCDQKHVNLSFFSIDISLNERLFKCSALMMYCDYVTNNNLLDNSKILTYLIINNLVDLLNLINEFSIYDLISMIHRNASASSLFMHSINSNWTIIYETRKLQLLYACLRCLEAIHLSVSGHLLNFLVDKYFHLPYLSVVRYADFIACQRLEMMQSLPIHEIENQLSKEYTEKLLFFFNDFKFSHRHHRFISLLKKLNASFKNEHSGTENIEEFQFEKTSIFDYAAIKKDVSKDARIEYFEVKNCFKEILESICYEQANLKTICLNPKQCALLLSNLDYNALILIMTSKNFKLNLLKECLLLGNKKASHKVDINSGFETNSLWLASSNVLFELLNSLCLTLPKHSNIQNSLISGIYLSKIDELLITYDLYSYVLPLIESINTYLECIIKHPNLRKQFSNGFSSTSEIYDAQSNDILTFYLFVFNLVSYTSKKHQILTSHFIYEVMRGMCNMFISNDLRKNLIQRNNYTNLLSFFIINFYDILIAYFIKFGEQNFIYSAKSNVNYRTQPNDLVFSSHVFDTLLKLRYILSNNSQEYMKQDKGGFSHETSVILSSLIHRYPNRFLQYDSSFFRNKLPFNLREIIDKIYLGLCHLPILDRFLRISDTLWFTNLKIDYAQLMSQDLIFPGIDQLKDPHILKEHIKHILRVGWDTRTQFEYEYVNMLTLLHSICMDDNKESFIEKLNLKLTPEEIKERNKCACLVLKALSSWLVKTTFSSQSTDNLISEAEFLSRNKPPIFSYNDFGKQYATIKFRIIKFTRNHIFSKNISASQNQNNHNSFDIFKMNENEELNEVSNVQDYAIFESFSKNLERPMINDVPSIINSFYYFSQINLEGLLRFMNTQTAKDTSLVSNPISTDINKKNITNIPSKNEASFFSRRLFVRNKLDLTSVLRTIMEHYDSFMKTHSLQLKIDILKSMIYISNSLFDSKEQYEFLIQKLQDEIDLVEFFGPDNTSQTGIISDILDDSTAALLLYGQSICRCCLQSTQDTKTKDFEIFNKIIDNSLKASSVLIKIASLHGLLFWQQLISCGYINNSTDIKQISEHMCKQISLMKDFVYFATSNARYVATLWSSIYFTIENSMDSIKEAQSFVSTFIKLTLDIFCNPNTPYFLFYQLYLGLERLLLSNIIPSSEVNCIQKIFGYKFNDEQRMLCLTLLQLTVLYSSNQLKSYWNAVKGHTVDVYSSTEFASEIVNASKNSIEHMSYPQILELTSKPELQIALLKILEVATGFFDKMKTSNLNAEASVCACIVPYVMCDFLPPHDILNKLIMEFSNSSQLPYPEAMVFILYRCFELLEKKGLYLQIQEWCLLSLSSFLLRPNLSESIWLLSCLLISASKDSWLRSLFPFILNRNGMMEEIDRRIFCIAILDFKSRLIDQTQLNSFNKIFDINTKISEPFFKQLILILQDA